MDPRALRPGRPGTPQAVLLSEWIHVATQGRDHYVKTVEEGLLYPFGHRAAQVTVTERKVVPPDGGVVPYPVAYLKQHKYIIVREKEKSYPASAYPFAGREMPFASNVTIHTLITPDIDKPPPGNHYWINVGGSGFPFHLSATDPRGRQHRFPRPADLRHRRGDGPCERQDDVLRLRRPAPVPGARQEGDLRQPCRRGHDTADDGTLLRRQSRAGRDAALPRPAVLPHARQRPGDRAGARGTAGQQRRAHHRARLR